MKMNWLKWLLRLVPSLILLQTLYFKFTDSSESVYIFTQLNMEPWGRIGSGIAELIAAILLLIPRTTYIGAGLALGIMGGALLSHLFLLGIEVQDDGGLLFVLALVVAICTATLLWMERQKVLALIGKSKSA